MGKGLSGNRGGIMDGGVIRQGIMNMGEGLKFEIWLNSQFLHLKLFEIYIFPIINQKIMPTILLDKK